MNSSELSNILIYLVNYVTIPINMISSTFSIDYNTLLSN